MDMSLGIWRSQVIATLAELGVADILKHGPKTAAELASLTGVADPDKMFRLMRAAVGLGIFAGDASALEGPVRFRNNRLSAVLREDHPNTVKWMLSVTAVDMHKPWGALKDSLQQGQEGDLPSATSPHDVYVLRNILHDWTDDHCISILKSVKAAVGDSNATLAVIENVLAPGLSETMPLRLLEDIAMLVTVDGKERTRREWEQLLSAGGFHIRQVHAIGGVFSILEAEAV
ncbi:hypothetical protein WJX72_005411 [[Myrmecia] bisecta]|uniref:O-methyltransferase n=1 Tax=[Myrmecia] bisecta TaxID=41462 RepID=A0AAW1Q1G5_9CHLO